MESRLAEEEDFARCLLPRGTRERLARLLPLLLKKYASGAPNEVGLRLTRGALAEMVASTRESVTKAMIELRDEGLVQMQGGRVSLPNPEMLADIGGH
jgi:CRP-like cAMP-binding protein